jgi:type IV pilus assembly protein PilN
MQIKLNLATRPYADFGPAIKRLRIAMAAMALLSIGFGIGLHLVHHGAEQARARERSVDAAIARVEREREGYMSFMRQTPNAQLLAEVEALNQLFDHKAFSWTLAMEDLETVLPGGVQVSSIEPVRDKSGDITLHMQVIGPRDREDDLVANLEHSKRFLAPRIVGENAAESSQAGAPTRTLEPVSPSNRFNFDLLAEYNPATLSEIEEAKKAKAKQESAESEAEQPREGARQAAAAQAPQTPAAGNPGRMPYTGAMRKPASAPRPNAPPQNPRTPGGPQ